MEADGVVGPLTENRLFRDQLSVISMDGDGSTPHFDRQEFACGCEGESCDGFPGAPGPAGMCAWQARNQFEKK